jgi:hypothetical protein
VNANEKGITAIKNDSKGNVRIFYQDKDTGDNTYIENSPTPAEKFSLTLPELVGQQSNIKAIKESKIGYRFQTKSDKIQLFVAVNDYYFRSFKPTGAFTVPLKGDMFTYDGIEGSHQLIFERVDMIN